MSIYYNGITQRKPGTILGIVEKVSEEDRFYKMELRRAKASREKAIEYDCTGSVFWVEEGELYRAHSTGSWDNIEVLPGKPATDYGINWATDYFATKEEAIEFSRNCRTRHDDIRYSEAYDVYSVHYHKFN